MLQSQTIADLRSSRGHEFMTVFWFKLSLNIFYLINSSHVYKQEHTYKSITEFINWDSERSLDDLFKFVSQQI